MQQLTDNQERLLAAIRAEQGRNPRVALTSAALGQVRDRHRNPLGDAARKVAGRLESRGLIASDGHGAGRTWALTDAGQALIDERQPVSAGSQSDGPRLRPYVVLEQTTLGELYSRYARENGGLLELDDVRAVEVYVIVAEPQARNTEHAYRQVAKEVYGPRASQHDLWDEEGVYEVSSVAIDASRWKVEQVRPKQDISVSIG